MTQGVSSPTGLSAGLRLKTVFDATRPDRTGHLKALLKLHLASWRAHVRSSAGLTVVSVTEPPGEIIEYIGKMGAELEVVRARHPLFHRSPIYNKHLAAPDTAAPERIFLTDNDTVYLCDVDQLIASDPSCVGVTLAALRRVSPTLWEELRADLDLPVIPLTWVPWKVKANALLEGQTAEVEKYAYFNGGAILFPADAEIWRLWEAHTYRNSAYFEGRGLHDRKDAGSDQLSLTAAVGEYGKWVFLPPGYNVVPFHYSLNERACWPVAHQHLVGVGRSARHLHGRGGRYTLSELLRHYWQVSLFDQMRGQEEARDQAVLALRKVLKLVSEFELDRIAIEPGG